ncbi:AMP-binding protein [Kitasatospora sp. NBC_01287]|uniref:AMP-binding protein n=1 Tax=Kitasatospora sp. NBC_01287 TaxID=2903573 RepID=UPI002250CE54|nr:AMP-binding protein [Kitasatospora sp. NBC_01287]MCX4745808.1 AMP-binding protein [Kitasatospora sp. NBC_01287]
MAESLAESLAVTSPSGFTSYVESVLGVLARDPGRVVLTTAGGRQVAAGPFRASVYQLARELAAFGIGRGSTVVLLSGNRPELITARYAANLLGARIVALYEGMAAEPLVEIVRSVEPDALIAEPRARATAERLLAQVRPAVVLTLGPSPLGEDLLARAASRDAAPLPGAARPEDDWCIRHTGGTTGTPKGIRMPNAGYGEALTGFAAATGAEAPPRFLASSTLAHLAGMMTDAALLAGGSAVLHRGFDPGQVLAAVERERITDLWVLPPLLYRLLDEPGSATTDLSSLRRIIYGGCAASPVRLREARKRFGPVLFGAYGQSEAGLISLLPPEEHTPTRLGGPVVPVGRAVPGIELAIRDEADAVLPPGRRGEVTVRTSQVMTGYWQQPELTAEVLRDGWVRTGDVGYLDDEGYLYLVDRLKDMIIVVGGHVYPTELEELLLAQPDVAACAAFGVPGPDAVEEVRVAVVPARGRTVDPDRLRAHVAEHMGAMYTPSVVHVLDAIPLTPVGKPDKKLLQATYTG